MAENNELGIQVGVVLDTSDIGKQLAAIKTDKNNSIKISANLEDVKKEVKKYKESLGKENNAAKLLIDVLKGQSDNKIKEYVDSIHEKYVKSPIKITLDVDTQATTANINKAVGEMQQQVQKAVDQAAKVNSNIKLDTTTSSAGVQLINTSQIKEAKQELEGTEGIIKRIQSGIMQGIGNTQQFQVNTEIEKFNQGLGKTVTVYKELNEESTKLAGAPILEEVSRTYETNFQKMEQEAQKLDNALSKVEANFNKLQLSAKPLTGQFSDKANDALAEYLNKYIETMQSGKALSAEQSRQLDEVRAKTSLVIQEQTALQKAYERTLIEVQKQQNALETTYAKAFDKNATKTLFFENGDVANQRFAQPVIDQYKEIKNLLAEIENNARNSGLAITTEQTNQLSEAFAKLNIVISEQKNARWTATNFKETDTASFVERYKNMMVELSNALKDDGVYDRFQTKISELFATLNNVKSGDASTGDFLNQLRNIKQEINTFESSVKGKGIMAAFDISEDQLVRIKSLGKALSGQENTQGIENLKQKLAALGKAYEDLQIKMQAKGISRKKLNDYETEQKALDKDLQSINSMINNLGNESWVNSQNAGIADMKAKFAEYREEISKTVQLTPELSQRLEAIAQAMSDSGKVDVTNWKDYNNEIKTLKANIEEFKNSLQGKASQLSLGIEANQLDQINEVVNRLNSLDEQYTGGGVERIKSDFQSLSEEYQKIIGQLQSKDLTDSQFKELSKQAEELDQKLKQLTKEAATFGNQDSFGKFTASANTLKLNLERLEKQYAALIAKNPELAGKVEDLKQRLESLRPGEIPTITKEISNLGKEMGNASGQSAGLRGALTDAFGGLGSYLARFASSYYLISKTIQGIKKMVTAVKEVDTSLVELQKVTNLTGDSLAQFTDKAYQMGAQLGRTGKDVIDAATTFSRAGYDLNEATQLAQSALVMTNVGVDIPNMESAASDMISILKAFDIQAEESMGVIDKLYNVANKEPLDFGNITQMLVTAGGTLAQSGTKLEESMGLLTGAFATLRNSSVANGLIFISQRLRGLDEDGEAIDGLIPKLQSLFSSVGINIEDQNGELRSTFDILQDLAGVWDQLSSKQKQYFGEKVAGNRQVKTLNAIMQNWDVVADTIDKANNSQGEALKGNEKYMDSIQGRMTQLQSAFQDLAKTTINSDFVKGLVSAGTEVIKLVTSLGGLTPVLTTIIGLIVAIKAQNITQGIKTLWASLSTLFTGMSSGLSLATGWVGILVAVAGAIAMVVAHTNEANSALKKFEAATESYEKHKTKVENLNSELQSTKDRIEELEAKEHLTIIEQKELDRLKEVNTQLQTQIDLEEKLAEIAQGQARDAATKVIEEENGKRPVTSKTGDQIRKEISENLTDDIIQDIVADSWKTMPLFSDELSYAPTNEEQIRLRMEAIKQDYAELVKIQEQIANLKPGQAAMKDELDAESDAIAENIKNNKEALSDYYNWLENKTEGIDYVKDAKPGSQEARYNELLDFKKAIGDALLYEDVFNPPINDEAFNKVLSRYPEAIKEIQDQLKEASSEGWELDIPEDLAQELMSKFDLTMDEVKQIFQEKYGEGSNGLQLDIGPQMSINMEDVIGKLYQTTDGYTKVLSKALSEQEKAGTLTAETLEKVMGESGLEGVAQCLERTADGYRLNTERVNEYISAQNEDVRLNAIAGIMERQIAIEDLAARYGDLETAVLSEADAQNLSNWQNEIIQLQAVADNAIVAADALDALREASKTSNEDADHTEAQDKLKNTKEMYESGKVGTDDFKTGMDYLLGEGWYEKFNGDIDKAFKAFEEKRKRYFADDDADSALNFMKDLDKKGFADYDAATGKIQMLKNEATGADYTLEEIASAFGISEDAARDMFELLNAYSFEDKFTFGEDALDSADKIAAAEKKLEDLEEQKAQKEKELEAAKKEYENATDDATKAEKAEEVKRLSGELEGLNTQYNNLATSVETAKKAMEEKTETPQTLDEALEKIKEYQAAIATLEENGITCPVELTKDRDTLIKLLSNPTTTMTVNASKGTVDDKIEKLVAFREAIEKDPNISATVRTTLIGLTDSVIKGLQIFKNTSREIDGKTYKARTTIKADNQATVIIKEVEDEIDEIPEEHDTTAKATMDEDSFEQVKTKITTWLDPESLTAEAKILAQTDDDSIKTATDKLDKVAEDRTVTYTITTKEPEPKDVQQIRSEAASDPNNLNKQAMAAVVQDVPLTPTPGPGFSLASDPTMWDLDYSVEAEVEAKPNEERWQEGVEEVTEDPVEITVEPEKTPEEVADEFTAAWGESWTQPFEIPIGTSLDEEEATQEVEDAIDGMTPPEAPIDVDSESLADKIKNVIKNTKLGDLIVNVKQKVEKAKTTTPKDVTQTVTVKGKDAGATKPVQDVRKEAEKGATVPVDADTTEAKTENKNLVDIIKEKVLKPVGLALGDIGRQISELEQRLAQEVQKKVKITYEETNQRPYAKGTKKAEEGISLVDEKGAELIEHTKRGTFELGTNDGARLTHLDEGDVVHTAEETKKILSRLADAGGFFRNGLNKAKSLIGNAFATGVSGGGVVRPKKKKEEKETKKKRTTGSSSGGSTGSSSGSSSETTKDETSKWSEWARQFFDWVEIKLKKLKNATKEFTDEAARAVGAWAKNDNIKEAIDSIDEEIDANKRAYDEYLNTANEVLAHSTKLTNDILRQIANGTIDVTRYDEVTQQQIKDYQTWYEKAIACRDAIKQLTDQQRQLAKQSLQNIVDDYSAYTKIYDTEGSVGAAQREYYESLGKATQGTSIASQYLDSNGNVILGKNDYAKNAYEENAQATEDALNENIEIIDGFVDDYGDAIDEFVDLTLDLSTELESGKLLDGSLNPDIVHRKTGNEYGSYSDEIYSSEAKKRELEEARSYLQSEFDALVSQGLVRVGDDTWLEYTNKLKELDKDIYQTGTNIEKLKDQANDAALIPFRNQISDFTYEASKATQEMDLGNERGSLSRRGKRNTYEDLIDNAQSQNKNLAIQNKLYEQLQTGLDKNSQKYQDLEKKIRDNETAMLSNEQAIEKYKNAITQLRFDEMADDLEDLTNASDAYNDEITIKTLKGIELTESAYKNLINNGKDQINNLNRQKASYQALMKELVRLYGEEAKSSDLYRQYESQVDSLDASIRAMSISMLEWQDEMENIKVEKIGWQIDRLKNQADALSDALSMKNAKGVAVVSKDYQQLIDNANEQRRNLLNQNAEYLSQQRGMDVNSKAYQDLQSKIESNLKSMRSLDASTVQWSKDIKNIPVQKLGWDLDKLKDISDQLSDSLNLKELKGIEVVDRDYSNLISNANERRNLLLKQNAEYIYQQKGMDKYSEAYQELEGKIRSTQEELRQLDESTIKWKKDMASLKVQKLSWQLDELNAAIDRINNRKSLNETQGYDIASDVYQSLIENSMRRIELLKQENQLLQNQQVGMDKNSTAYQELQKQIVDNINEIDSIKISQEEWNDNIIDTGIKNIQKYRDSLSKSNDQLQRQKELQQAIQELEKADNQRKVRTYVEGQGFVYQRDEDEFRKAQENLEDVIKDQLLGKIDDLIDALEESKKDTNVYDKNGNLLGSVYNTPQLGNLADLLTKYYASNNNAMLDIDMLKNAFGKNIVSNINPQNTQTSFSIGDIVINEVKDGNELARTIVDQFPNALLQALYKK